MTVVKVALVNYRAEIFILDQLCTLDPSNDVYLSLHFCFQRERLPQSKPISVLPPLSRPLQKEGGFTQKKVQKYRTQIKYVYAHGNVHAS